MRWQESDLQAILLDQASVALLELLAHVTQFDAGLNEALGVRSDLSMHLAGVAHFVVQIVVQRSLLGSVLWVRNANIYYKDTFYLFSSSDSLT
jgi:hypothetical protein